MVLSSTLYEYYSPYLGALLFGSSRGSGFELLRLAMSTPVDSEAPPLAPAGWLSSADSSCASSGGSSNTRLLQFCSLPGASGCFWKARFSNTSSQVSEKPSQVPCEVDLRHLRTLRPASSTTHAVLSNTWLHLVSLKLGPAFLS